MIANIFCNEIIKIGKRGRGRHIAIDFRTSSSWPTHSVNWQTAVVSLKKGSFYMIGYLFWLNSGRCLGSICCFCKGTLPVTCWAGELYSMGCPLFCIALSATNTCVSNKWAAQSSLFNSLTLFFLFLQINASDTHVQILVLSLEAH